MRYILYARKSSEGDERQVQSIPDQQAVLCRLAAEQGLDVCYNFEEAHSAKEPNKRPIFAQMLRLLEEDRADAILCWNVNRLFRNPVDEGTVRWLLQRSIIKEIRTPERQYLPSDSALLLAVEGGLANQFIVELSRNLKRSLREKAERGEWPGKAPPGYINYRETVNGIELRRIRKDPEGFDLMRRAWETFLSGGYTGIEIHEQLQAWGYRAPKAKRLGGRCISLATLYECFKNPFYYGWFKYNGELFKGTHPAMVSKEEFDEAQRLLGRNPGGASHAKKHSFAFTGLIQCGICGHKVTAERRVKHYRTTKRTCEYTYYRCNDFRDCRRSVAEWEIENRLKALLARCTFDKETTEWIEDVLRRDSSAKSSESSRVLNLHDDAMARAKVRMRALLDMRLNGELSPSEFLTAKNQAQEEIARLEGIASAVLRRQDRDAQTAKNLVNFLGTAYERFTKGSLKNKREVAVALGGRYTLNFGRVQLKPHPLLVPLLKIGPRKNDNLQVQNSKNMQSIPALCRALEEIRTLIKLHHVTFPQLFEPL